MSNNDKEGYKEDPRFKQIMGEDECLTRAILLRFAISYHDLKRKRGIKTDLQMANYMAHSLRGSAILDDKSMNKSETAEAYSSLFFRRI